MATEYKHITYKRKKICTKKLRFKLIKIQKVFFYIDLESGYVV